MEEQLPAHLRTHQPDRHAVAATHCGEPAVEVDAPAGLQAVSDQGGARLVAQVRPFAVERPPPIWAPVRWTAPGSGSRSAGRGGGVAVGGVAFTTRCGEPVAEVNDLADLQTIGVEGRAGFVAQECPVTFEAAADAGSGQVDHAILLAVAGGGELLAVAGGGELLAVPVAVNSSSRYTSGVTRRPLATRAGPVSLGRLAPLHTRWRPMRARLRRTAPRRRRRGGKPPRRNMPRWTSRPSAVRAGPSSLRRLAPVQSRWPSMRAPRRRTAPPSLDSSWPMIVAPLRSRTRRRGRRRPAGPWPGRWSATPRSPAGLPRTARPARTEHGRPAERPGDSERLGCPGVSGPPGTGNAGADPNRQRRGRPEPETAGPPGPECLERSYPRVTVTPAMPRGSPGPGLHEHPGRQEHAAPREPSDPGGGPDNWAPETPPGSWGAVRRR